MTADAAGLLSVVSGDFSLSAGSPYLTAATDGSMIGADVEKVTQMTAGAR